MEKVRLAELIATGAHYGQVDKGGRDYINHPAAVASLVDSEIEKVVAWLHDVVEDTDVTFEEIEDLFGLKVVDAVNAITRREGEDRAFYLKRVKENPIARQVKIADLTHNSDLTRITSRMLTKEDYKRRDRYLREMEWLKS